MRWATIGRWVVTSAWPYINSVPHLGNMIGSVLSADVYARFLRMIGEDVVFVSGSDEHGTVIEVEARRKGVTPKELTDVSHEYIVKLWELLGISFDNYTRTESEIHKDFVQNFLTRVYENGFVEEREQVIPYCSRDNIYLPDRFVEGVCPYCGFEGARGDQCDNCGRLLEPDQLVNPRCVLCGSPPVFRSRRHWFFRLDMLEGEILSWITGHEFLEENVRNFTVSWIKTTGLAPRSLTRDNKWGIPAPFPNSGDKTVYVWFDALLGYLSATKEYFSRLGRESEWVKYWLDGESRTAYFIGKDNIPFHAVILPALLMATRDRYNLPTVISATEYLMYEGRKFSKSRRVGVWIDEALKIVDAVDYWRYSLIRMRPEDKDTNFKWSEFVRFVNNELNDHIGNLIHRVLTLINRFFDGVVEDVSPAGDVDAEFRKFIDDSWNSYKSLMLRARLRDASELIVKLGERGNQYVNVKAPWAKVREDVEDAKVTLNLGFTTVLTLAVMLYPITPGSAERIFRVINVSSEKPLVKEHPLELVRLPHRIGRPEQIFTKLPQSLVKTLLNDDERERYLEGLRNELNNERPEVLRF
ncbi:MAG: methionine--tRNA ligase [Zestosphaera sp.]